MTASDSNESQSAPVTGVLEPATTGPSDRGDDEFVVRREIYRHRRFMLGPESG